MKLFLYNIYYKLIAYFARNYIQKHKPYVIGINGSVGKTSCRIILSQTLKKVLPQQYKIYTSPKNFNWELWLSYSILKIEKSPTRIRWILKTLMKCRRRSRKKEAMYNCIILEYWIDRPKEMEFLLTIVQPDIWIFTKIDSVHSESFWTPQAIAQEEAKMIKATKEIAFLNADDTYARQLSDLINIDKFFYVTTEEDKVEYPADIAIHYTDYTIQADAQDIISSSFTIHNNWETYNIQTNLFWKENYWYISLAFAVASVMYYKITKWKLHEHLSTSVKEETLTLYCRYKLLAGRLSIFHWIQDSILIDSTYNASPLSMRKIIETTYSLKKSVFPDRKIAFVMWDMRELWQFTEQDHRKVAWPLHMVADHIVLIWPESTTHTYDELCKIWTWKSLMFCYKNSLQVGEHLKNLLYDSRDKWIVVCKGSQNTIFLEEAIKMILPKKERKHHHHYLCRQSKERMRKKEIFFSSTQQ